MAIEITAAISTFKAALGIAQVALAARDEAKVKEALQDMSERLFSLSQAALAMAEKNMALQAALTEASANHAEVEAKLAERGSYELAEASSGVFAYKSLDSSKALHYLCQPCYDNGIKSVLRKDAHHDGVVFWTCPAEGRHGF
ncbi:hypothetical protein J7U46_09690 [Pelomonas sp. V22]|uniref:hypothetical protein n=1 Tax=Pelomonas sp. V22 TaxID=2822139 RepID=UPI0024A8A2A1|nr:hypothetical protein [Pelomonas sp. V22]MDI4633318.1 hypothetical protein [Pelomonas sp. V22]